MSERKTGKRLLSFICLIAISVLLFGCMPDLNIEDEADYGKKFPSVKFVNNDLTVVSMPITDLYNDNALNNFRKDDFVCPTKSNAYKYMGVFAGENVEIREFAIYLCSKSDARLNIEAYIVSDMPSSIATGTDTDFETYTDEDTGEEKKRLKSFDEPKSENKIGSITVSVKAGNWTSFTLKQWTDGTNSASSVALEKDKCLLFKINNNCVTYNDQEGIEKGDEKIEMCFTAMLICIK